MDFCDCADKCKSKEHGNTLCSSLTKRDITDAELCAYFNQICFCCEAVRDAFGRTTLHLAASVGRANVVKWLLKRKQININARDFESGYTALHRSIFYGKINAAVALLHAGASNVLDHENLTCLDHAVKNHPFCPSDYDDGEVYVWGTNSNYIFGIQQARQTPDIWDIFHKEYPFELVKQINLGKFHCVVVTGNGNAYSCGHGQGGRLGIGSEQTILTPKLIKFTDTQRQSPIYCIQASIARDHTVFLAECDDSYQIWSCGLNTHHVLGINPPPSKQLTPKRLSHFKQLFDGVCAARYHSVAWGPKAIYTWGLHGGQLGHDQNTQKYIVTPKLITRLYKIKSDIQEVVVSSGATVVLLASGDLFVFHEYQCRILSARQKLSGVAVVGGRLNTSLDTSLLVEKNSELKILALTQHGKILLWQESDPHLVRCVLSLNREISVTQIYLNMCEILFVDNEGEAYQGTLKNRKKKSGESSSAAVRNTFHRFIERDECHFVKITKLPRIHKAISITSDSKGGNFAIIQANPKAGLTKLPEPVAGTLMLDLKNLLEESDEEDFVHDVLFKVGTTTFAVHRYIISCSGSTLHKLISNDKLVEVTDVHADIFKEFLLWIYTGDCSLLNAGPCPKHLQQISARKINNGTLIENVQLNQGEEVQDVNETSTYSKKNNKNNKEAVPTVKDAVRLLQDLAKRFEFQDLEKRLSKLIIRNGQIVHSKSYTEFYFVGKKTFNRHHHEELYDVTILTKGGHMLQAHKCILVARVDFFQKMYSNRWNSQAPKLEVQIHYPKNVVEVFLEFLYTDNISNPKGLDFDTLCSLIILSDEYFVVRLREICEVTLCNLLSYKNAVQLLTMASLYNAEKLKIVAMKFISLNLCAFLESKSLENLEDDLLDKLTNFYCKFNKSIQTRVITPYSNAPSDEQIRNISNMYPISLDIDDEFEVKNKVAAKTQRKRIKSHKNSLSESKSDNSFIENSIIGKPEPDKLQWENDFQDMEGATCDTVQKTVPIRIKAITKAHEQIQNEDSQESQLIKLTSTQSDSSCSAFETSYEDFPLLNSPSMSSYSKSPVKSERTEKLKITRISQKQRKRLSSEESTKETSSVSESPKNPWKINELTSPIGSPEQETSLSAIVMEEKKQRDNLNKIMAKPLLFTQIEDKAIEDLQKFYNSSNCSEEVITTERVSNGCLSTPIWVHKSK